MKSRGSQSPPFQFGIRSLLAATAVVAIVCSLISWVGWSGEMLAGLLPLVCFVAYQLSYGFISRCIIRGSWDGSHHTLTAALAIASVVGTLFLLLALLL
ncbi:MAG: hypothetical protein ACYSWU_06175 [Planctomycetota bacterium]